MLFVYIAAITLAVLVCVGAMFGLTTGYEVGIMDGGRGWLPAMFVLLCIIGGTMWAIVMMTRAAIEELVYWDFPEDIAFHTRKAMWNLIQKLHPTDYVVYVKWNGYCTEKSLGLAMYETTFHTWYGTSRTEVK